MIILKQTAASDPGHLKHVIIQSKSKSCELLAKPASQDSWALVGLGEIGSGAMGGENRLYSHEPGAKLGGLSKQPSLIDQFWDGSDEGHTELLGATKTKQ